MNIGKFKTNNTFNYFGKKVCYAFLIFHLLASQIFLPSIGRKEIFPIFNWSLFSSCRNMAVPEMKIWLEGGNTIISKQFSRRLSHGFFYRMETIFNTEDLDEQKKLLHELLNFTSYSLHATSFRYKIFKSDVPFEEYLRQNFLKKETLFMEGIFKRDFKNHREDSNP